MALEGTLKDFSLADIFQLIGLQRKTGILTLQSEEDTVTITFDEGYVVGAESVSKKLEDRLGRVLVKRGVITDVQLEIALEKQNENLQRLGYVLIKSDLITQEELKSALEDQLLMIIYRLFRWKEGYYHFHPEKRVHWDKENIERISAESILMEGVRMLDEWPRIERIIDNPGIVFNKIPLKSNYVILLDGRQDPDLMNEIPYEEVDSNDPIKKIEIESSDKKAYLRVDGNRSVQEIVESTPQNEFETYKSLFNLYELSLIEKLEVSSETIKTTERTTYELNWLKKIPSIAAGIIILTTIAIILPTLFNKIQLIVGPDHTPDLNRQVDILKLDKLKFSISLYYLNYRKFPKSFDELIEKRYIVYKNALDSYKNLIYYSPRLTGFSLVAAGKNGVVNQSDTDDILINTNVDDINYTSFFSPSDIVK